MLLEEEASEYWAIKSSHLYQFNHLILMSLTSSFSALKIQNNSEKNTKIDG